MYSRRYRLPRIFCISLTMISLATMSASPVSAGFLDFPDIEEVPELERKSLLLDLDIPPVRDRDPDPEGGPRLNVREFRLQGLVEYPELGIYRQEIIDRVEAIRFDLMSEQERLQTGYTQEELAELSDLIAQIEEEVGDDHVGPVEVQRLIFLIREQRRRRGITVGMIETVADTITGYYREKGFVLAKAYIPEQRVRDGIVNLTLLLGTLGEVEVVNNRRYREAQLRSVFDDIMGEPVTNSAIEERLFLLNDLPGLSVQGYFEPGSQLGDTRLNVNVSREKRFGMNFQLDNHGSDQTGENRIYTDFTWNNPTGLGDKFFLAGLYASDPGDTAYYALRYSVNLFSPRFVFGIGTSNNDFALGKGNSENELAAGIDLGITGESRVNDLSLSWILGRSRTRNFSFDFALEEITSDLESTLIPDFGELTNDKVFNSIVTFNYDLLNERKRRLHQGSFSVTAVDFQEGAQGLQKDSSTIFAFDYTWLSFLKLPFLDNESRLIARLEGQFAGDALSSINQFGLAGPTRARGFAVNEFYADDALYAGLDLIFPSPFGPGSRYRDAVQPFVFLDLAWGEARPTDSASRSQEAELADLGVGLKFSFLENFRGNLQFATPIMDELSEGEIQDDGSRVYLDVQYGF